MQKNRGPTTRNPEACRPYIAEQEDALYVYCIQRSKKMTVTFEKLKEKYIFIAQNKKKQKSE